MDNKTARQDLETVIRVEDLALGSMRKLRAIQDWLREKAERAPALSPVAYLEGGEVYFDGEPDMSEWIRLTGTPLYTHPPMQSIGMPEPLINWTEHQKGNETIPYDHVTAETPFGRFEITWKGWKEHDCPTVDETPWGDYFGVFESVEAAKECCEKEYDKRLQASLLSTIPLEDKPQGEWVSFQQRVQPWLLECFGEMIAGDREERNHRFLEEALELVQACDCTADEAHKLVDYVFSRPVGEKSQEVGGVHVTLAALCLAQGIDGQAAAEAELSRITQPEMVERIREKQKRKPSMSPLPGVYPDREEMTSSQASQENTHG